MDRSDLRFKALSDLDGLLNRKWLITGDTRRILIAARVLIANNDTVVDQMLEIVNRTPYTGEKESDPMTQPAYLTDCPDCVLLPTVFPSGCFQVTISALLNPSEVSDIKCAVHCAASIGLWALGLWIYHEHPPMAATAGDKADFSAAAAELQKCCSADGSMQATTDLSAVNWKLILTAVLALIQQLLNQ